MVSTSVFILVAVSTSAQTAFGAPSEREAMPLQKQVRDEPPADASPTPTLAARQPQVSTVTFGGFEFPGTVISGEAFTLAPTEGVSIPPITVADVTIPGITVPLMTVTPTGPLPSDFFEIPSNAIKLSSGANSKPTSAANGKPSSNADKAASSTSSGGAAAPAMATGMGMAAAGAVAAAGLLFV